MKIYLRITLLEMHEEKVEILALAEFSLNLTESRKGSFDAFQCTTRYVLSLELTVKKRFS